MLGLGSASGLDMFDAGGNALPAIASKIGNEVRNRYVIGQGDRAITRLRIDGRRSRGFPLLTIRCGHFTSSIVSASGGPSEYIFALS